MQAPCPPHSGSSRARVPPPSRAPGSLTTKGRSNLARADQSGQLADHGRDIDRLFPERDVLKFGCDADPVVNTNGTWRALSSWAMGKIISLRMFTSSTAASTIDPSWRMRNASSMSPTGPATSAPHDRNARLMSSARKYSSSTTRIRRPDNGVRSRDNVADTTLFPPATERHWNIRRRAALVQTKHAMAGSR